MGSTNLNLKESGPRSCAATLKVIKRPRSRCDIFIIKAKLSYN
jgi:hypothetical protein